jgi:DNA-binding transcriptional regulator GbsR (MarR family)
LADGEQEFVEKMGVLFAGLGVPRSAGKIAGWLIICEQPQTLDDIAKTLHISKAAASTSTRLLETYGLIERMGKWGDRKTYYRPVENIWQTVLYNSTRGKLQAFIDAFRAGQQLVDPNNTVAQERLARLVEAYTSFQAKLIDWAVELARELLQEEQVDHTEPSGR